MGTQSQRPALFTSDVRPREFSAYLTERNGIIKSLTLTITDIAPEEAQGTSMERLLVIYWHFSEIATRRYGKPKQRSAEQDHYVPTFVTSHGVGIKLSGNDTLLNCCIESPDEMFIASEYARLVAKGYISEGEWLRLASGLAVGSAAGPWLAWGLLGGDVPSRCLAGMCFT